MTNGRLLASSFNAGKFVSAPFMCEVAELKVIINKIFRKLFTRELLAIGMVRRCKRPMLTAS